MLEYKVNIIYIYLKIYKPREHIPPNECILGEAMNANPRTEVN